MRRIGSVAIVFIGLWAIMLSLSRISGTRLNELIYYNIPMLAVALLPTAGLLVFGVVLIKNHWRLTKRWFHDSPFDISVDGAQLLRLALIFLGFFWITSGIAELVAALFATIEKNALLGDFSPTNGFWSGVLPTFIGPLFEVALGAYITTHATPLAHRLWSVRPVDVPEDWDEDEPVCSTCGEPYDPSDYRPGAKMKCSRCGMPLSDISSRNFCANCGKSLSNSQAASCPSCGTEFIDSDETEYECSECGADISGSDKYCPNCGELIEGVENDEKQ